MHYHKSKTKDIVGGDRLSDRKQHFNVFMFLKFRSNSFIRNPELLHIVHIQFRGLQLCYIHFLKMVSTLVSQILEERMCEYMRAKCIIHTVN